MKFNVHFFQLSVTAYFFVVDSNFFYLVIKEQLIIPGPKNN